jgi:hypothetical protein
MFSSLKTYSASPKASVLGVILTAPVSSQGTRPECITFEYEADPADNGHRPGIYIETKIPDEYPGLEEQVYAELARIGWNPLEGEIPSADEPFWKGDRVNVGNTRGKILVQTFSRPGMMNFKRFLAKRFLPASSSATRRPMSLQRRR